jgi:hypothetical protein
MVKRKTQYKRNPRLKTRFCEEHFPAVTEYQERAKAWLEVLLGDPSEHTLRQIADILARLGFEPDEYGEPQGPRPLVTETNPLVLLDGFKSIGRRSGEYQQADTLRWKADVLEVATLVWAGVALSDDEVREIWPDVLYSDVWFLLNYSDLATFWNRPGVGKKAADIRAEYERGEFSIDPSQLGDWLKKKI